jgi:two-component system, OmpR family, sensor histidine kinase MprB
MSEVRLDILVADAVSRMRARAPGTPFVTDLTACLVDADSERLARAVRNLLDNAVKWSPPGAAVEVSVGAGEVSVRDHGPGVDAEHRDRAFDRFWRAPRARSLPGSGLGLAIVRQVVQDLGGTATLDPAPGGGTVARMVLPWREVRAAPVS